MDLVDGPGLDSLDGWEITDEVLDALMAGSRHPAPDPTRHRSLRASNVLVTAGVAEDGAELRPVAGRLSSTSASPTSRRRPACLRSTGPSSWRRWP